ncbi:MAG: hypothetical protein IKZ45_09595 [Fibrobacter sp.]|jgi:hypothetical protein|nr:hypothetical protein [Fibrobacter sp.]
MLERLSSLFSRHFWPVFILLVAVSVALLLWAVHPEDVTYADMACTFAERNPGCVETVPAWSEGLVFYDSTLSVTGDTLVSLKALLWDFWGIEFAGAGEGAVAHDAVLPLRVLETRRSGCLGLVWLAMMAAEARQIPLQAILLPGHVFLRYVPAGKPPVNLEPNRRGYSYSDDEYREKYREGKWSGLEFKPLDARELAGLAAFDIGNLFLDAEPTRALRWYRLADDLFPAYPGIRANQDIAKSRLPDSL